jgi:hypothetical protein
VKTSIPVRSIIAVLLLFGLITPAKAYPRIGTVERVDISEDGKPDSGDGWGISLSEDGRFAAFSTDAPLVSADVNLAHDIYLRDFRKGTTELISRTPQGLPAIGKPTGRLSDQPMISLDGRYVAFKSYAINLTNDDTNGLANVFVYDRALDRMELVSKDAQGKAPSIGKECTPNACSWGPSISGNGRFVSFSSFATLIDDDTNEGADVYVRDRKNGRLTRVSVDSDGNEAHPCPASRRPAGLPVNLVACPPFGNAWFSSISANGRYVAFESDAADLVDNDNNGIWDVFVHDLRTKETERVSVSSDGSEAVDVPSTASFISFNSIGDIAGTGSNISNLRNRPVGRVMSNDGRFVIFRSYAGNLVPSDSNRGPLAGADAFVHDRTSGRTERVSVTSAGREVNNTTAAEPLGGGAGSVTIDADGRFVMFTCNCKEIPEEEEVKDAYSAPFVFDRLTGAINPVAGSYPGKGAGDAQISPSGRFAAFSTAESDGLLWTNPFWRTDLGEVLGVNGFRSPGMSPPHVDDKICVTPDVCIPPGSTVSTSDDVGDVSDPLTEQGANLYGASLAYRPQYNDLFAVIELEHMPKVLPGVSPIFYGLRFKVEDRSYEVRATSLNFGTFGLFDCTGICTKVADLRGGYGTTGMRVAFSLPIDEIGLDNGGKLKDVTAYSALGGYLSGTTKVLDRVKLK